MAEMLESLSATLASANSLEAPTRPLLEMLEVVTGLESTCLTSIDEENAVQSITIARNTGELLIPEGLTVPWSGTLCKRCLEQGRRVVSNVSEVWADSQAAAALGIQTYARADSRHQWRSHWHAVRRGKEQHDTRTTRQAATRFLAAHRGCAAASLGASLNSDR